MNTLFEEMKAFARLYTLPVLTIVFAACLIFYPLFNGKKLYQPDKENISGKAQEKREHLAIYGEDILWANTMFCGMPSLLEFYKDGNYIKHINIFIRKSFSSPIGILLILGLSTYILATVLLKKQKWLAVFAAIAAMYMSYNIIGIEVGHNGKINSLAYVPLMLSGIILCYRKSPLPGGVILAISTSLMVKAAHHQIVYYAIFLALGLGLVKLFQTIQKEIPKKIFVKGSIVAITAAILGAATNTTALWSTKVYGEESIRGKASLLQTDNVEEHKKGVNFDYAFEYSYSLREVVSLFIPRFAGGGQAEKVKREHSETAAYFSGSDEYISLPLYFGEQPIVAGANYIGAGVLFLFLLFLTLYNKNLKWLFLVAIIISLCIAMGKHIRPLAEFMFHYFPMYSKFRTPTIVLGLTGIIVATGATLGLSTVLDKKRMANKLAFKKMTYAYVGCVLFLFVFGIGISSTYDYSHQNDFRVFTGTTRSDMDNQLNQKVISQSQYNQILTQFSTLSTAIQADRKNFLVRDTWRTILFVSIIMGIIVGYHKMNWKYGITLSGVIIVTMIDLWGINIRYLNDDDYIDHNQQAQIDAPGIADQDIYKKAAQLGLEPTTSPYRVFNISVNNPFADGNTSKFHHSVGGYYGAKLRNIQDMFDPGRPLQMEFFILKNILNEAPSNQTQQIVNQYATMLPCLNMLNARFFIQNKNSESIINHAALGNAWFIDEILWADSYNQEIEYFNYQVPAEQFHPEKQAILNAENKSLISFEQPALHAFSTIDLIEHSPKKLTYQAQVEGEQSHFAVFSEIYYEGDGDDWQCTIDGERTSIVRTNYLLRGIEIPPGDHTIVFEFIPTSYYSGRLVAHVASILIVLIVVLLIGNHVRSQYKLSGKNTSQ